MLCTLRVIFTHAFDDELVEKNPAAKLDKFTNVGKLGHQPTALTREEAERFLRAAEEYCL